MDMDAIWMRKRCIDRRQVACGGWCFYPAVGCAARERTALKKILHGAVGVGVAGAELGLGDGAGAVCVSERLTVMRWLSSDSTVTLGRGWESPNPAMRFIFSGVMA